MSGHAIGHSTNVIMLIETGAKVASTLKIWVKHLCYKRFKMDIMGLPWWLSGKESACQCRKFSSVQSLSHVWLFANPWTAARQASLSITNPWSLPKLMSIELMMPSNHLILCHPILLLPSIFPNIRVFSNEQLFPSGGQNIGVSASTTVLPMNTQDWFPLGQTGWISLQSKGLSRVFSYTTVQKHQFICAQLSL